MITLMQHDRQIHDLRNGGPEVGDDRRSAEQPALTILGAGYVGRALLQRFPDAIATRRQPADDSALLRFDLTDRGTWTEVPVSGRHVVMTFPAQPLAAVKSFHDAQLSQAASLIALGSTSAYRLSGQRAAGPGADFDTSAPDAGDVVDVEEASPLDMTRERVCGEEWLRQQGASVLQLAGIFGPGRDPASWLNRGRIRDGAKLVNLIHVEDIVFVIAELLAHPRPGLRINLANGEPIAWRDLKARLVRSGRVPADPVLEESMSGTYGKRVLNGLLRAMMPERTFLLP